MPEKKEKTLRPLVRLSTGAMEKEEEEEEEKAGGKEEAPRPTVRLSTGRMETGHERDKGGGKEDANASVAFETASHRGNAAPSEVFRTLKDMSIGQFLAAVSTADIDLDAENPAGGGTLLTWAAECHRADLIRALLARGADPLKVSSIEQRTPLQWATVIEAESKPGASMRRDAAILILTEASARAHASTRTEPDTGAAATASAEGDEQKVEVNTRYEDEGEEQKEDDDGMSKQNIDALPTASCHAWMTYDDERKNRALQHRKNNFLPRRVITGKGGHEIVELVTPGKQVDGSTLLDVVKDNVHPQFGLGICLYFRFVPFLGFVALACGLVNIPMAQYYASTDYDSTRKDFDSHLELVHTSDHSGVWWIPFSALCEDYTAVCLDSECSTYAAHEEISDMPGQKKSGVAGNMLMAHKNCQRQSRIATYLDLGMTFVILMSIYFMWCWCKKEAERVDVSVQTAQDYSVVVHDPDPDATDPEEWRDFFQQFGDVFMVTVCLNNGPLVKKLEKKRNIELHLDGDKARQAKQRASYVMSSSADPTSYSYFNHAVYNYNESRWSRFIRCFGIDHRPFHVQHAELTDDIKKMTTTPDGQFSQVCKVFATFNYESSQRECLNSLSVGLIPAMFDWKEQVRREHLFRGTNLLQVEEAPEPSDIIYTNLHVTRLGRFLNEARTWAFTLFLNVLVFYFLRTIADHDHTIIAALSIQYFGDIVGMVLEILVRSEGHHTLSSEEASYFTKLQASRWFITVFCFWFIFDFTETNEATEIYQLYQVMLADALVTPIFRALDLPGAFSRHVLAAMAKTDERAKQLCQCTPWLLAERYSALTTSFMLSCFYGSLIPFGYFFCCISCFVTYWCDKYCLFRVWQLKPQLDAALMSSIVVALLLVVIVHLAFTAYFVAGFPFDMLCETKSKLSLMGKSVASTNGLDEEGVWQVCDQRLYGEEVLLKGSTSWWTDAQTDGVLWYRIATLLSAVSFVIWYCGSASILSIQNLFFRRHIPVGDIAVDTYGKPYPYDEVCGRGYIPQISSTGLHHSLQACFQRYQHYLLDYFSEEGQEGYVQHNLFYDSDLDGVDEVKKLRFFSQAVQFLWNKALPPGIVDEGLVIGGETFVEAGENEKPPSATQNEATETKFQRKLRWAASDATTGGSKTFTQAGENASPSITRNGTTETESQSKLRWAASDETTVNALVGSPSSEASYPSGYRALSPVCYRRTPAFEDKYLDSDNRHVFVREGEVIRAAEGLVLQITKDGATYEWIEVVAPPLLPSIGLFVPLSTEDEVPLFVRASDQYEGANAEYESESDVEVMTTSSEDESVDSETRPTIEESVAMAEHNYRRGDRLLNDQLLSIAGNKDEVRSRDSSPTSPRKRVNSTGSDDSPQGRSDASKAVYFLTKAANDNHALAHFRLGLLYASGDVFPQDESQAVKWFEKAIAVSADVVAGISARGVSLRQEELGQTSYNLGLMHFKGRGTPVNRVRALELWRLAYEAGDDLAKRALERFDDLPKSSVAELRPHRKPPSRTPSISSAHRFDRRSMLKAGGRGGGVESRARRGKFASQQAQEKAEVSGSDNDEKISDDDEFTVLYGASASAGGSVGSTINPIYRGFGVTDQMWGNI